MQAFRFVQDRPLLLVPALGAAGGFLAWMMAARADGPVWSDLFVMVLMGAGAALIFLFVIMNTDRSDVARLVALSLLAGFSWETVWDAGGAIVERHAEQARVAEIETTTREIARLEADLQQAGDPARVDEIAGEIASQIDRLGRVGASVQSVEGLRALSDARAEANSAVRTVTRVGRPAEATQIAAAARRSLNPAQIVEPRDERRLELLVTEFDAEQIRRAVREDAITPDPPVRPAPPPLDSRFERTPSR